MDEVLSTVGLDSSEPEVVPPNGPVQSRVSLSTKKAIDLEGEFTEILRGRSQARTPSQIENAEEKGRDRISSVADFNIFQKSIAYDSQYQEYEEEVVFKESHCKVKRVVSAQGELMLTALSGISRKLEVMGMLPELMSLIVTGDSELEQVLGPEVVEAILRLYFIQTCWIEYRNVGEEPFRLIGAGLAEIKRRLQKGARYPLAQRKRKSLRVLIQESSGVIEGPEAEDEGEGHEGHEGHEGDQEEDYGGHPQVAPAPSLLSGSVFTSPSTSVHSLDLSRGSGDVDFGIGPRALGIPTEKYMREVLGEGYREVFRLVTTNQVNMTYLGGKVQPEVTQAVKIFYGQIQLLEGLMYVKFLVSPEEEIRRIQHLKTIWIKEQRLLREYRDLEEDFGELGNNRERVLHDLNFAINALIVQIDAMSERTRYEINKLSGEGGKQDLVNTKKFDQDLQQLDGNFQAALKFAMHLRANYNESENGWRKQRFKLEADLEALISNYDKEMSGRQQSMDDCLMTEEANRKEIEELEKINRKVEARYALFKDETMVREIKKKKKKGSKGKKGKKGKRGRSGKKKKSGSRKRGKDSKGGSRKKGKGSKTKRSKSKKGKSKGSKKGKKKGKKSRPSTSDSEYEGGEEEGQVENEQREGSRKRKRKEKGGKGKRSKGRKSPVGDSGKEVTAVDVPLGDDTTGEEEEEENEEGQGISTQGTGIGGGPESSGEGTGSPGKKKKGKKKSKKGKRSKSKGKKKKKIPPPPPSLEGEPAPALP